MTEERKGFEEPVDIVAYDPGWPAKFERERTAILQSFGDMSVEVHHVGSTAVPGLAAKPIIDILVAVESLDDRSAFERLLSPLGYVNVAHDDDRRRLFFRKGTPRSFHAHVVKMSSWTYWRLVIFRDVLRSDPEARAEYERLKFDLSSKFKEDRAAYTDAKSDFIERTVADKVRVK